MTTAAASTTSTVSASPEENVSWKPKMPTVRASMKPTMVPAISAGRARHDQQVPGDQQRDGEPAAPRRPGPGTAVRAS